MTPQQRETVTSDPINLCLCPWVVHLLALSSSLLLHPKLSLCVRDCVHQSFQLPFKMNFDQLKCWALSLWERNWVQTNLCYTVNQSICQPCCEPICLSMLADLQTQKCCTANSEMNVSTIIHNCSSLPKVSCLSASTWKP